MVQRLFAWEGFAMGLLLLILLVVLLFGSVPAYPYSRGWGYRPMGLFSLLLIILLALILFDVLELGFGLVHPWHRTVIIHRAP
jgi:hypothetical protein